MRAAIVLILLTGSIAIPVFAKHQRPSWGKADVVGIRRRGFFETYTIENEMCRFTGRRLLVLGHPRLTVGKQVKYSQEGRSLYIVDELGRNYKLRLVRQTLMPPLPPPEPKATHPTVSN